MLQEGDIFNLEKGHSIYVSSLPSLFLNDNGDFNWENSNGEVRGIGAMQRGLDTSIFCGEYIVTKTSMSGGGTGHEIHDVYPNGHKVIAKRIVKPLVGDKKISDFEISFYQSGSFTCMNRDIEAVRKAELKYTI